MPAGGHSSSPGCIRERSRGVNICTEAWAKPGCTRCVAWVGCLQAGGAWGAGTGVKFALSPLFSRLTSVVWNPSPMNVVCVPVAPFCSHGKLNWIFLPKLLCWKGGWGSHVEGATYACPGMHMQQRSAVLNDTCVLHCLTLCTLGKALMCSCGCGVLSTDMLACFLPTGHVMQCATDVGLSTKC